MPITTSKKTPGGGESSENVDARTTNDDDIAINMSDSDSNYSDDGSESDEEFTPEENVDPQEELEEAIELSVHDESEEDPDLLDDSNNHLIAVKSVNNKFNSGAEVNAKTLYEEIKQIPSLNTQLKPAGFEKLSRFLANQGIRTLTELEGDNGYRCTKLAKQCLEHFPKDSYLKGILIDFYRALYPHPWYGVIDYIGTKSEVRYAGQWILWDLVLTKKNPSEFPSYIKEHRKEFETSLSSFVTESRYRNRALRTFEGLDDKACKLIKLLSGNLQDASIEPLAVVMFCKALSRIQINEIEDWEKPEIKKRCAECLLTLKSDESIRDATTLSSFPKIWFDLYSSNE